MDYELERIGILTGGGDCPGLNAVLRAVVRRAMNDRVTVLGIRNGWAGLISGNIAPLDRDAVSGILPRGGTIIGSSRVQPLGEPEFMPLIRANWAKHKLQALIVVGGEGTLRAANEMCRDYGFPVVGIPKTIDNDLCGTDFTIGMDTAVTVVTGEQLRAQQIRHAGEALRSLPGVYPQKVAPGNQSTYWFYALRAVPEETGVHPELIAKALRAEGIACSYRYIGKPIFLYEALRRKRIYGHSSFPFDLQDPAQAVRYEEGECPNCERALNEMLTVPLHEAFTEQDVQDIATAFWKVIEHRNELRRA
ncbi:MAG: hypothetical protein C4289_06785 [Chloroflexota bacterium]